MVSILVPSRDAAPRQDSARATSAPPSASAVAAPIRRQDGPLTVSAGSPGSSVGNLLYLGSVGLIAAGVVAVFFGAGFSLLAPSGGGASPRSAVRASFEAMVVQPTVRAEDQALAARGAENVRSSAALPSVGEGPAVPRGDAFAPQARAEAVAPPAPESTPAAPVTTAVPAPDVAAPTPLAQPSSGALAAETRELLQHGDSLLRIGDVASARLFYERATAAGNGWAALRLGATFDPAFLERLGLGKLQSDPAAARSWYNRAVELGVMEAKRQLNGLEARQGK